MQAPNSLIIITATHPVIYSSFVNPSSFPRMPCCHVAYVSLVVVSFHSALLLLLILTQHFRHPHHHRPIRVWLSARPSIAGCMLLLLLLPCSDHVCRMYRRNAEMHVRVVVNGAASTHTASAAKDSGIRLTLV